MTRRPVGPRSSSPSSERFPDTAETPLNMRDQVLGGRSNKDRLGSVAESWGPIETGRTYGMFQVEQDPPSRSASPFRQEEPLAEREHSLTLEASRAEAILRARLGTSHERFGTARASFVKDPNSASHHRHFWTSRDHDLQSPGAFTAKHIPHDKTANMRQEEKRGLLEEGEPNRRWQTPSNPSLSHIGRSTVPVQTSYIPSSTPIDDLRRQLEALKTVHRKADSGPVSSEK